jgi:hypothetical protein
MTDPVAHHCAAKETTVERTDGVDFHSLLAHEADENGQLDGLGLLLQLIPNLFKINPSNAIF